MKVYIVWMGACGYKYIGGIFSSVEKAREFLIKGEKEIGVNLWSGSFESISGSYYIEEHELDLDLFELFELNGNHYYSVLKNKFYH